MSDPSHPAARRRDSREGLNVEEVERSGSRRTGRDTEKRGRERDVEREREREKERDEAWERESTQTRNTNSREREREAQEAREGNGARARGGDRWSGSDLKRSGKSPEVANGMLPPRRGSAQ